MDLHIVFPNTSKYLESIDITKADKLDIIAKELMADFQKYERASQALRKRFSRGAGEIEALDRGGRKTKIRREKFGGKYKYFIEGSDGNWNQPDERIWVVAMYALWQASKKLI